MSGFTIQDLEKHIMPYKEFKAIRGNEKKALCKGIRSLLDSEVITRDELMSMMQFTKEDMARFMSAVNLYGKNEDKPKIEKQSSKPKQKKQEAAPALSTKEPDELTVAPEPQPSADTQEISRLKEELAIAQRNNMELMHAMEQIAAEKEPKNILMNYQTGGTFNADQVTQKIKKALLLIDGEPYQYKFSLSLEQLTDYVDAPEPEPEKQQQPQPEPLQNQLEPLQKSIAELTQQVNSMKETSLDKQAISLLEQTLTKQQEELATILELMDAQDKEVKALKEQQQNKNAMADWQNAYAAAGIKGGDVSEYEQANEELKKKELTRENTKFEVVRNEPQFTDEHGRKVHYDPSTGDGTRVVRGITEYQAFMVCPKCSKKGKVWVGKGNKVINCNNPSCGEPMKKKMADLTYDRDIYGNYFLGGKAKIFG